MATTPPDDEDKDQAPAPPADDTSADGAPDHKDAPIVEVLAFRYTAEVAATASERLQQVETLLWFKELDAWGKARVRQVLLADELTAEDQLTYTLAALLTGMELYIEALQQAPELVA